MHRPPSFPDLNSRLLHLCNPDGSRSDFVILLGRSNEQIGGIFDTKDRDSLTSLQKAFEYAYRTPEEREEYTRKLLEEDEAAAAKTARRIHSGSYQGALSYKEQFFRDVSALKAYCTANRLPVPNETFAAERFSLPTLSAEDLWIHITAQSNLDDHLECVPGSDDILNDALQEFYKTNKDRLVGYQKLNNLIVHSINEQPKDR